MHESFIPIFFIQSFIYFLFIPNKQSLFFRLSFKISNLIKCGNFLVMELLEKEIQ